MAYDLEITINTAHDLKNVNWKHGDLCAYAVAWVEEQNKLSTRVDASGDTHPSWGQKFTIPVDKNLDEARLTIQVYHDKAENPEKAIVGSLSLPLTEILDAGGSEETLDYSLKLKRPSGRPHGKIEFSARLRSRKYAAPPPPPSPYGAVDAYPHYQAREGAYPYVGVNVYPSQGAYPYPTGYPPQPAPYADPYGQPYSSYQPYGVASGAPPAPQYAAQSTYDPYQQQPPPKSGSKFGGLGTGLAVGALAGAVGGLALSEYIDHEEEEAAERQAEEDAERYGGGDEDY